MKWLRRILGVVLFIGLAAGVGGGGWLVYLARTRVPDLDGVVAHRSLKGEVRVVRDDWGVPHIEASNEPDAYFALGYVMAQDRLFQMEALRRLAAGELAELLGPPAVPVDKIVRCFRLRANAEAYFASAHQAPAPLKDAADAFVAGINHCMETQPLPFEFAVLHIPPRPFTTVDCLTVAAILPITFADGLRTDVLATMLREKHPEMDIEALFPGYSKEIPVTIMESLAEAETYLKSKSGAQGKTASAGLDKALAGLRGLADDLQSLSEAFGSAFGSNSWVLGPSRTRSGKAILANDPHIGFTNPSVWYEAHIRVGDYDNYGYHLPLIPFALLGHNRERAWAMTMFENDDVDLYRETFKDDDPSKVMYKGEWVDARTEIEIIKVRFGRDVQYPVRVTPHGPVITDLHRKLSGYEGPDISMAWIWQQVPYTDMQALYEMGHARDCDSFGHALALVTSPGINISYADAQGNIAWWAAGLIPIRPKHVNPKSLLDGASGKDEILGFVPFEQNPHLKNPACGYIVTANNKSTVKPVGPVEDLEGYWQPGDRAGRIKQILDRQVKWSVEELKAVQFDDTSYAAPAILSALLDILQPLRADLAPLDQAALDALGRWDHRHAVDSVGASVFEVLCDTVLKNAVEDEMGPAPFRSYCTSADHWNFLKWFVHQDASPFWDNVNTPQKESRRDIVLQSLHESVATLRKQIGDRPEQWTWGTIHTMEFRHPFGYLPWVGRILNIGPFPSSGASQVVNNMLYMPSGPPYHVLGGPSTRRLIDFADPEHSLSVLPTGNSGNFMSPHYADQARLFMTGKYREPRFTKRQIEAHNEHELHFVPTQ